MAKASEESAAVEITVAVLSRLTIGGDIATRADEIGEAAGKIYAKVIEAIEAADR